MDDFDEYNKYEDLINAGKVKSTFNSAQGMSILLVKYKERFPYLIENKMFIDAYFLLKIELSTWEHNFIKKHELVLNVENSLTKAENLLFGNYKDKNLIMANQGLSVKHLLEAYRLLCHLEGINGLFQSISKTPEQKIRKPF